MSKSPEDSFAVPAPDNHQGEHHNSNDPTDNYDPFDLENLRIDQSYLEQPAAKRLLVTVSVRTPSKQDFVRVHPGAEYRNSTSSARSGW
jgi:hypothetical protein